MSSWDFAIGEFVQLKSDRLVLESQDKLSRSMQGMGNIIPFMIVGRQSEECIGGVQYHYRLRIFQTQGTQTREATVLAAPFEIEAYKPIPRES